MKKLNSTTLPTYHHNNTNNSSNNNHNTNNNNYQAQNEQLTQNHYSQRQHQQRNRCQIIPSEQFLLPPPPLPPTQYRQQHHTTTTTANNSNYQLQNNQQQQIQQNIATTMSSATTSNFLPNQFNNFSNPQYLSYQNQQPAYQQQQLQTQQQQQQLPNYTNFHRSNVSAQQQLPPQQQQQPPHTQLQRRQQLQLPLFNQNNMNQHSHQRRQLFEQAQQQFQPNVQISTNAVAINVNNLNNCSNAVATNLNGGNGNQSCNETDKFSMDANEIANFIANELFMQQLVSVDGMQSGVPTLTTSTLTPTTLKSIEETLTQLVDDPVPVPYQAGFVPPSFPSTSNNTVSSIGGTFNGSVQDINEFNDTESDDSRISYGQPTYEDYGLAGDTTDNSSATTDSTSFQNGLHKSSLATSNSNSASTNDFTAVLGAAAGKKNNLNTSSSATTVTPPPTRRNQGGRRPAKASNLSPEEEEKRRVRRERNKLAAARCRKRRVDLTNELLEEVAQLEKKREGLQKEIESYNTQKQELQFILEAHHSTCEKVRQDILTVSTYGGIIAPSNASNDNSNANITGLDTTLASTGRSSPIDLKPVILTDSLLSVQHIKDEPLDTTLDSNSLDNDDVGPTSPKRMLLTSNNPMIPPPLPKIATLSPSLAAAASASLHTPIVTVAPVSFGSIQNIATVVQKQSWNGAPPTIIAARRRPTTLPTMPRNAGLGLNVEKKPPTDINGVAIQTPSTGMFNFDSLMDGGTGLTPVSGPLVPTCSSQNKHPLELTTPTSEPSKLVSL